MRGKNIIEKLFSVALPKARKEHNAIASYSSLLQARTRDRHREGAASERFTYRSVTACIH